MTLLENEMMWCGTDKAGHSLVEAWRDEIQLSGSSKVSPDTSRKKVHCFTRSLVSVFAWCFPVFHVNI